MTMKYLEEVGLTVLEQVDAQVAQLQRRPLLHDVQLGQLQAMLWLQRALGEEAMNEKSLRERIEALEAELIELDARITVLEEGHTPKGYIRRHDNGITAKSLIRTLEEADVATELHIYDEL